MTLQDDFDALSADYHALKVEWETAKQNLLSAALVTPGTLRFGGNTMQLGLYGAQILSKGSSRAAVFFFDDRFQTDPNSPSNPTGTPFSALIGTVDRDAAQPYSQLSSDAFAGTATAELSVIATDDANDSAVSQSYVNVGAATGTVRHELTSGNTFAQLILSNTVLRLASFAADPASVSDGDMWYRSDTDVIRARINGATVSISTGGGLLTDTAWAAAGDLVYGTGNDTATILSHPGSAGLVLTSTTGPNAISWAAAAGGSFSYGKAITTSQGQNLP